MQIQKHSIMSGDYQNGELFNGKEVGYSFLGPEDEFYTLKLNMFPIISFFIVKNTENDNYTIYSKILRGERGVRFKKPVGFAKLLSDSKSLMMVRFHLPRMVMYMDLFGQ